MPRRADLATSHRCPIPLTLRQTCGKFAPARGFLYYSKVTLGDRLVVGRRTLDPSTQVRILVPQPILLVRSSAPMAWTRQEEGDGHAGTRKPPAVRVVAGHHTRARADDRGGRGRRPPLRSAAPDRRDR